MDITNAPPRVEIAVPLAPKEARLPDQAMTGRPETANPVTAAAKTGDPSAVARQGPEPLDVFQVGDNDDLPVPPDPPRQSLAMVAVAQLEPSEPDPEAEEPSDIPQQVAAAPTRDPALAAEPYQSGTAEPVNPTVDIRR